MRSVVAAQLGREEQQEQDHGPAGIITTSTVTTTNNNSLARTVGTSGPAEAASRKREREREVACETLLVWSPLESVCRRLPLFVVFARSSLSGSAQKQSTRFHAVS